MNGRKERDRDRDRDKTKFMMPSQNPIKSEVVSCSNRRTNNDRNNHQKCNQPIRFKQFERLNKAVRSGAVSKHKEYPGSVVNRTKAVTPVKLAHPDKRSVK